MSAGIGRRKARRRVRCRGWCVDGVVEAGCDVVPALDGAAPESACAAAVAATLSKKRTILPVSDGAALKSACAAAVAATESMKRTLPPELDGAAPGGACAAAVAETGSMMTLPPALDGAAPEARAPPQLRRQGRCCGRCPRRRTALRLKARAPPRLRGRWGPMVAPKARAGADAGCQWRSLPMAEPCRCRASSWEGEPGRGRGRRARERERAARVKRKEKSCC